MNKNGNNKKDNQMDFLLAYVLKAGIRKDFPIYFSDDELMKSLFEMAGETTSLKEKKSSLSTSLQCLAIEEIQYEYQT